MKMQRWETECEENPPSKDPDHLSKRSFSTEGSFVKERRGEWFIVGQKGWKAGCLVANKVPALKCDAVLSPESDPLWASGCQECSQLGSGAREKIKHTHKHTHAHSHSVTMGLCTACVGVWVYMGMSHLYREQWRNIKINNYKILFFTDLNCIDK